MVKSWYHIVDPRWLEARHSVVTATELRDLRSAYKKATISEKNGTKVNQTVAGLYAEKRTKKPDPASSGSAARGHILEPYAIDEYNTRNAREVPMHHWDDTLIRNGFLGFSPDAMSIPQYINQPVVDYKDMDVLPTEILEIKSYQDKNHLKAILTEKNYLPERFQLAGAMLVCPSISRATICFYNPNSDVSWGQKTYERCELQKEIDELLELANWVKVQFVCIENNLEFSDSMVDEDTIYSEYLEEQRLNAGFEIR